MKIKCWEISALKPECIVNAALEYNNATYLQKLLNFLCGLLLYVKWRTYSSKRLSKIRKHGYSPFYKQRHTCPWSVSGTAAQLHWSEGAEKQCDRSAPISGREQPCFSKPEQPPLLGMLQFCHKFLPMLVAKKYHKNGTSLTAQTFTVCDKSAIEKMPPFRNVRKIMGGVMSCLEENHNVTHCNPADALRAPESPPHTQCVVTRQSTCKPLIQCFSLTIIITQYNFLGLSWGFGSMS